MDANDFKLKLVEEISNCDEILGIGQTGDMNAPLIPLHLMKNEPEVGLHGT